MSVPPLVTGLMTRFSVPPGPPVEAWNPEVSWASLQATQGGPIGGAGKTKIDGLIANAGTRPFRLRLMAGYLAPQWLKNICGSMTLYYANDPQNGSEDVVRWYHPAIPTHYEDLQNKLAALYDGQVSLIWECGTMVVYAEPCLIQAADSRNRTTMLAHGYTKAAHVANFHDCLDIMAAAWSETRVGCAFNDFSYVTPGGAQDTDPAVTNDLMTQLKTLFGDRGVLQNNSLRTDFEGQSLYSRIKAHGPPISIQTAQLAKVGNLAQVLEYCITTLGCHAVELPIGFEKVLTPTQIASFDARLSARAPAVGPGQNSPNGFDAGEGVGEPFLFVPGKILAVGFDAGEGVGRPTIRWQRQTLPPPSAPPPSDRGRIEAAGYGTFPGAHLARYNPTIDKHASFSPTISLRGSAMSIRDDITAIEGWFIAEDKTLSFVLDEGDDASSWDIEFTLTRELDDAVVFTKTTGGGGITANVNLVEVTIAGDDTVDLPQDVIYRFALSRTDVAAVLSHGEAVLLLR